MDLAEWLLEQIAEDETGADEVHLAGCAAFFDEAMGGLQRDDCDCGRPARVLAECAAKRAIVEEVASWTHEDLCCRDCGESCQRCDCGLDGRRQRVLAAFALPYADRAGWAPAPK